MRAPPEWSYGNGTHPTLELTRSCENRRLWEWEGGELTGLLGRGFYCQVYLHWGGGGEGEGDEQGCVYVCVCANLVPVVNLAVIGEARHCVGPDGGEMHYIARVYS